MKTIASLLVGSLMAAHAFAAAPPSPARLKAATELLQVTGAERAAKAGTEAMIENLIKSQPAMAPYRSVFEQWSAQYISWRQLGPQVATLYANAFTTPQLEDLIHFYQTPTGRKAARLMPVLARQAVLIGSALGREHVPELQQMIRARAAELQKTGAAPAGKAAVGP